MKIGSAMLRDALARCAGGRVTVVGDVMVDQYFDGDATRISPEAPVPVVRVGAPVCKPGGAANVARNVRALGGAVALVGLIGTDPAGEELVDLLAAERIDPGGLVRDPQRPTTQKIRVRAAGQQIVRVDRESDHPAEGELEKRLLTAGLDALEHGAALLMQDYDKGVFGPRLIQELCAAARQAGKPVAADPKFRNFFEFQQVTLFKPNRLEAEMSLGCTIGSDEEAVEAALVLQRKLQAESVLLTRGRAGMTLISGSGRAPLKVRATARDVFDVSGAGDTVIATLTLALAAGVDLAVAVVLASIAAGIEVGRVGVAAVEKDEIIEVIGQGERTWAEC